MRLFLALITFICITFTTTANASELYRFAFIGFNSRVENAGLKTDLAQQFPALQEMMTLELGECEKVELVDTTGIVQQFNANEMVLPLDENQIPNYAKAFNTTDVDYYIYGYITNMSVKESVQAVGLDTRIVGDSKTVEVDISVNIVDAKTFKKVFVATGKGQESTARTNLAYGEHTLKFGGDFIPEENIFKAIEKAARQVGAKITKNV